MKTKITIIALIAMLFVLPIKAQEQQFQSVLNNGMARWSMVSFTSTWFDSRDVIVADRDTLINGVLYRKIYNCSEFFHNTTDWQNYTPNINYLQHDSNRFIRENEDASRLYVFDARKNAETVIFDLNLEIGDNFVFTYFNPWSGIVKEVTTYVDTVFIKNGLKHISFDYSFCSVFVECMKLTFIEGVGPNIGIEDPTEWWPQFWIHHLRVNCFQNDILFYMVDGELNCCGARYVNIPKIDSKDCNVWLESGNLAMSCNLFQYAQVVIYNMFGQRRFSESFSNLQHISIPISNFRRGVYVLRISDRDSNRAYTRKIIF